MISFEASCRVVKEARMDRWIFIHIVVAIRYAKLAMANGARHKYWAAARFSAYALGHLAIAFMRLLAYLGHPVDTTIA
jgi:hypothetical protein